MHKAIRSAIVLAGGRSSRMGSDKATLRLGDDTILHRVVAELGRAFGEVVVVAGTGTDVASLRESGDVTVVRDAAAFQGPVAALRLGLGMIRADVAFACACDLPFVSAKVAAAIYAMVGDRESAVPMVGGRLQVLHAAYHRRCIDALDRMIERDERRLQNLVPLLDARIVDEAELRPLDPELRSFFNLNTHADYERARAIVRGALWRIGGKSD